MVKTAHTHGRGKWSTCLTWTGVQRRIGINSYVSNIPFERRPNPPGFGNGRADKSAHDLELAKIAHMVGMVCQAQEQLLARSMICWAPKYVLP